MYWLRICAGPLLPPSDLDKTVSLETITAGAALRGNGTQQALGPVLTKDGNAPQEKQAVVSEDLHRDLEFSRRDPTVAIGPGPSWAKVGPVGRKAGEGKAMGQGEVFGHLQPVHWGTALHGWMDGWRNWEGPTVRKDEGAGVQFKEENL